MLKRTDDLRVTKVRPLISPETLLKELPLTETASNLVEETRSQASDIIHGKDPRLLVVCGPCSIHDVDAAMEYGEKLSSLIHEMKNELLIIMRVYFEKPRTTVGWKGLINDPDLDNSFLINKGLHTARELLLKLNEKGVPCGTEFLDTVIPQYLADLISWGAIGARTTESQIHREMTSGLSMPIGFKNGTMGSIQVAIDAIYSASSPHHFLGVTKNGIPAVISTSGNPDTHLILRGSNQGPNYDKESIADAVEKLEKRQLPPYLMVDCSHGNSNKDYKKQKDVVKSLCKQIESGSKAITGVMLESHLKEGSQQLDNLQNLDYGVSITDACIGFKETVSLLQQLAKAVKSRR